MRHQPIFDPETGQSYVPVAERGRQVLDEPLLNKGTAFPPDERLTLGIAGLLPSHVSTHEQQVARVLDQMRAKDTNLQKHIYLAALHDRNEHLFYRLVVENLEETVPLIYTPTVAEACKTWSHIFRRGRGLYISPPDVGSVAARLRNSGIDDAKVIVVTDNERILGIGDQGAGGMGIPIGKLSLYTAGAGIHPAVCLPVSLDTGTDNEALLNDPLYLGYPSHRVRGDTYFELVDELVTAVKTLYPGAILQWEDFANSTSFHLLDTYREVLPSFNDDIQGTAAMVLGGLYAAMRLLGERIRDQRVVIAGSGSAGIGIARQIKAAMIHDGLSAAEAAEHLVMTDSHGLVVSSRADLPDRKRELATDPSRVAGWGVTGGTIDLETCVARHVPSILIGVTGKPGTFTQSMVAAMAAAHDRPVIMPMSNPTSFTEALPSDIISWSGGRALVATGSPFGDVVFDGEPHRIGQANNVFIFPGVGLGTIVTQAKMVTVGMFLAAARALADSVSDDHLKVGALFPPITDVRSVSRHVAIAVATAAIDDGVAEPIDDLPAAIDHAMWKPCYLPYRAV
ncbi:MAG: NAD-dependent malic enzyme [Actinomycetota bacterium]